MDDLAKVSGGRSFVASDLSDARAAFARVAADIGTLYSLGYYPTNKARDGKFRSIQLQLRGLKDKAQIRARDGYYAPNSKCPICFSLSLCTKDEPQINADNTDPHKLTD
jgi:Ca-activated chloride channel family protein